MAALTGTASAENSSDVLAGLTSSERGSDNQATDPLEGARPIHVPESSKHAAPDAAKAMTLFVMIVASLYFGREVLVPISLALLLAFILTPLVTLLRRLHLGRVPSVLLALLMALSVILAIGGVIGAQIAQLSTSLPQYIVTTEAKIDGVRAYTVGRLAQLADRIGSQRGKTANDAPSKSQLPEPAPTDWLQRGSAPLDLAQRFLSPVLSPLVTLGLIFVVAVFALLQQDDLRERFIKLLGADDLDQTTLGLNDATVRLSRYFMSQVLVNTVFGIVIGVGLLAIGVPNPVLFGILSALLRFVPYVGSLISALLPMALAAAVDPGWFLVLWTALFYLIVEGITGQVVEPLLYAHNTGLSPFSVVVAAIFWSWLWGPIGLVLSTPLTMCLVVIGQHVQRLRFLDIMLGDAYGALPPAAKRYSSRGPLVRGHGCGICGQGLACIGNASDDPSDTALEPRISGA